MAIRYISKGKGKNRKSFPIRPKKKGVSVRTVSLKPSAVVKVNKEQIKLLNRGETTTFSKALNRVIIRAKREIPIYDTHVNTNNRRKPYQMFVTDMKKHKKVKGTDTIVMADSYGQAVDDFITVWNKDPERMKNPIGYPVVQGTADRSFRYARGYNREKATFQLTNTEDKTLNEMFEERGLNRSFFEENAIKQAQKNPKNIGRRDHDLLLKIEATQRQLKIAKNNPQLIQQEREMKEKFLKERIRKLESQLI